MQVLKFTDAKVIVYGDAMLDRYWHGKAASISPEAPVAVLQVREIEERPGGASNVAVNVAALGAETKLFAACGEDEAGECLQRALSKHRVKSNFLHLANYPTITKLRVVSVNQQLIRLDFEDMMPEDTTSLADDVLDELPHANAIILSDYGKGTLKSLSKIIAKARALNIPTFVDPKTRDFNVYRGATLITPNKKEFEDVVGHCHNQEELNAKGMVLIHEFDLDGLLVTQGKLGMTLLRRDHEPIHLSTQAREVYDVTGAGDTVIAVLAASIASGYSYEESIRFANTAAGIVVGKLGASFATLSELRHELEGGKGSAAAIIDEEHLLLIREQAREAGETIVMTNGCFDILHPGHIAYLEQAKMLGDRLIVAVNDDKSVQMQNKGLDRPINPLEHRMRVLAGLDVVDWVVPFSEETPEKLIAKVLPDVLVKGGDWEVEKIAGAKQVLAHGGQVEVLDFVDGYSTTAIIDKIRDANARGKL